MYFCKWKRRAVIALCLSGIISIFSCEVGLGTAVDVAAPTVGITYPPENAVIRDTFIAAGECNDDMKISSVEVSVIHPESNTTYGPYEAEVSEDGTTWSVSLNTFNPIDSESSFDNYKQWEYPDGNYLISAVAYDTENKESPIATSPVSIDNTAPILIVSKPIAIGSEAATIYGSSFKLSGDIAEEHGTSKLTLYYRPYDNNTNSFTGTVNHLEITNSDELNAMSSSNPLVIAQFEKNGNLTEQHSRYVQLYGGTADDVDRYYYCGFQLEDTARLYQNPGDSGSGEGNKTQEYYLLGKDFQDNLAVNYSLTAQKLMNILRGLSDDYSAGEISSIIDILSRTGNFASSSALVSGIDDASAQSQSSKISLNPHNNPTWSLGEYGVPNENNQFNPYIAGSSLVLTVNAGRDASFPDPKTVTVDLYDLGETDSSLDGKTPIHLIGPEGIVAKSWDESADDSTKNYTFVFDVDSIYEKDHLYQMVVNGSDRNKTNLEPKNGGRYIFRFAASNSIPKVTITEPRDEITYGTEVNTNGVIIKGIINTDAVSLHPENKVYVSRLDISDVKNVIPVDLSVGNFDTTVLSVTEDPEVHHKYYFEIKLTAKSGFTFVPATESKYFYLATVQAKDRNGVTGEKILKFYVDNKSPDLFINTPVPVTGTASDGTAVVNGNITISGTASDSGIQGSGLKSLSYKILEGSGAAAVVKREGTLPLNESWSFELPTQELINPEQSVTSATRYTIEVTAADIFDNVKTVTKLIDVNQFTDRPSISFSNADETVTAAPEIANINMFGTLSNNKLYATFTDDDGLSLVKVEYQKVSPEPGVRTELTPATALTAGAKSYNAEYTLPAEQGEYRIYVEVRDNKGETNNFIASENFYITIDNGAPGFGNVTVSPEKSSVGYYQGSKAANPAQNQEAQLKYITVSGNITDGNGLHPVQGFAVKHYKKITQGEHAGEWEDTDELPDYDDSSNPVIKPASNITAAPAITPATSATFTDNITLASTDGEYKVVYTVKDKYLQTSTYSFEYKVDVTTPAIEGSQVGECQITGSDSSDIRETIGWIKENNVNILTWVNDAGSGIASVSYSLDNGTTWQDMTHSVSEDIPQADGSKKEKWIASVQFIDGAEKSLKLRVKDSVGNKTNQSITIKVDRTRPVLDVKWYQLSDGTTASSYFDPSGIAYVNSANGKDLIIYANYTDTSNTYQTDNSGINAPEFKIGSNAVSLSSITYYKEAFTEKDSDHLNAVMTAENTLSYNPDNPVNANQIKSFKAVIPHSAFANAAVTVSGSDRAGNEIENNHRTIITLVNDTEPPTIGTPNISTYKASDGTYYLRRVAGEKLTISGTSTDEQSNIDKTILTITDQQSGATVYSAEKEQTAWTFNDIDLNDWTAGIDGSSASIAITAYDRAGNSTSLNPITLKIDEKKPAVLIGNPASYPEGYSAANSNLPTATDPDDTSNPYISDYTLRGIPAWKYAGITIGTGTTIGKYGDTTYGRESSIELGITYIGEANGSGVKKMEYKMLASDVVPDSLKNTPTGTVSALPAEVASWTKTGEFTVTSATYQHRGETVDYDCYKGSATIAGFKSTTDGTPNLLYVRATDNCGNESDWFVLLIQMDNETPVISTDTTNPISLLTNGKSTLPTLKGTVSEGDNSSGLKAIRVLIDGKLVIDGNFTWAPNAFTPYYNPAKDAPLTSVEVTKLDDTTWTGDSSTNWTGWNSTQKQIFNEAWKVKFVNDYGTLTYCGYTDETKAHKCSFKDAAAYATWELTLTPQVGSWFRGNESQISLEVEDWADDSAGNGNKANIQICTFDIDLQNPSVSISSPVGDSTGPLNGKQFIKGSVTENHTAEKVKIYYSTAATPPRYLSDWTALEGAELTENLYSFNAGEYNFNNFIASDASSGTVHILAYVTDKAGNANVYDPADPEDPTDLGVAADQIVDGANRGKAYKTYTVDKNSDRPVVKITNASITTNSQASPLQLNSSTVYFTVSDDDGVDKVEYRISKNVTTDSGDTYEEVVPWEEITLSASGDASITFSNDGEHKLEFRVKDKENSYWFDCNSEHKIYLKDSASPSNTYDTDPAFYVRVETKLPKLTRKGIQFLSQAQYDALVEEGTEPNATDPDAAGYTPWENGNLYSYVVGGDDRKYLRIKVKASDEGTGIHNVRVTANLAGETIEQLESSTATDPTTDPDTDTTDIYTLIIPCTKAGVERENINFVATITAEDCTNGTSGKTRSESIAFKADTKAPDIIISSPEQANWVDSETYLSGTVIAEGQISESAKRYYAISPIAASPDSYTASTAFSYVKLNSSNNEVSVTLPTTDKSGSAITPGTPLYELCRYQPMNPDNPDEMLMSFYLPFDGNTDSSSLGSHSNTLNTWITNLGITTARDLKSPRNPFDDAVKLYLHIKAVDSAGNSSEQHYPIILEPLGSRPNVTVGYPSAAQAGGTNRLTLGGSPSIIGTATGTNAVDFVWLQVDCNSDGNWTAEDFNILKELKDSEDKPLYELGRMDSKQIVTAIEAGSDIDLYAIRVTPSGLNWVQQINRGGELNQAEGAASTKDVTIWGYSTDVTGLISAVEQRNLTIDSQAPVINADIQLVKWNAGYNASTGVSVASDGTVSFASGAVSAVQSYNDNERIKGKWCVVGKVTDESGIKTVSYKVNGGTLVNAITDSQEDYTGTGANEGVYVKSFAGVTGNNYVFCLPVGETIEDAVGQYSVEFTATENEDSNPKSAERTFVVHYDNKAPVIETELSGYSSDAISADNPLTITNSNGVFTFGGKAKEDKVGTIDQTGIERIVFYFTRNITGQETKLFDPMIRSGRTGNAVDYSALSHEQGLYWKSLTVNTSGHTITVSGGAASGAFDNIHKGGLVKIYDVVYRIADVNAAAGTISLSENENLITATEITAKFAIANVVDNATREGEGTSQISADYGYGYYSNGTYDDGDLLIESLIQEGTTYTWEANINSKNISDGPVTLHYVIFDKAGNFTAEQTFACFVKNNQPRLAGVTLGTDQDGNGTVADSEMISSYSGVYARGYNGKNKVSTFTVPSNAKNESASAVLKIKGKTVIKPEIVGGNGTIGYTYSVAKRKLAAGVDAHDGWDTPYKTPVTSSNIRTLGTGTADDDEHTVSLEASGGIVIDVRDFLQNEIVDGVNQKFAFTIWDSTPGSSYGQNSQSAVLNVIMDVALNDVIPAKNKIVPFYWKDSENNSLLDNSREKGHIELSKDLPADFTAGGTGINSRNPKVSGAIKLEGIAQDDTLLRTLKVDIDGTEYQIASYSEGTWTPGSTSLSTNGWSSEIREATYEEFIAAGFITEEDIPFDKEENDSVPYTSQEFGHVVYWTMNIDTQALNIKPKTGIEISASASDIGKPYLSGSGESATVNYAPNDFKFNGGSDATLEAVLQTGGNNGSAAHTCKYTIDVVPYITKIITRLSKKSTKDDTSEYDRTALGHYPVASTETIKIEGFNLTGSSSSTIRFTSNDDNASEVTYTAAVAENGFAIPANAKSGKLSIVVDGVESLNNSNNNDARGSYTKAKPAIEDFGEDDTHEIFNNFYNCKPNETNNYILTDDVELDIWEFNSKCAVANPAGRVDEPILKINPKTGIMGFAFLSGSMYFAAPSGQYNSYTDLGGTGSTGDFRSTAALTYDYRGWSYFMEAGGNEGDRVRFRVRDVGGNEKWALNFELINQTGTRASDNTGSNVNLRYKVRSPSIATSPATDSNGTANANLYMAYYDSYNDEIRFMSGVGNAAKDLFTARARANYTCKNTQVIATDATKNLPSGAAYQYTGNPLGGAGEFVCIDVIPAGTTVNGAELAKDVVVIVWYETATGNLLYSYNTNPRDISWRSANTSINEHYRGLNSQNWAPAKKIFTGCGQYCKVAVDGKGGIHIAGYDATSGDLRYAYLSSYGAASSYNEDTMSYIVDSSGNAGAHLTLDVALVDGNPLPYISYIGANIPKLAYLKEPLTSTSLAAGTSSDMFTGAWEVTYIPTTRNVPDMDAKKLNNNLDNRINVAVWKKTEGGINGILDNSVTETTTYPTAADKTSGRCWGNGTANPVLAYSILYDTANDSIESAQKR